MGLMTFSLLQLSLIIYCYNTLQKDCDGNCVGDFFLKWAGDGVCDDGTTGINMYCSDYSNDLGDCPGVRTNLYHIFHFASSIHQEKKRFGKK